MEIKEIIRVNGNFGFGQISNDPHNYWTGKNNGDTILSLAGDDKLWAIIKTDTYWIYVYSAFNSFALLIASGDKNMLPVTTIKTTKTYRNTVSPEALVSAAEEELRYINIANEQHKLSSLAKWRKAYGLTLDELAELSGVNRTAIHRFESGERNIKQARYDTLCKLADALQRTVEQITY